MHPSGPALRVVMLAAVFSLLLALPGCATPYPSGEERGSSPSGGTSPRDPADADPEGETLSAAVPARDVRGEPVPGLPRPPDSVRVGYSEGGAGGLALVRVRYLTEKGPGESRGFYRDAFRSGGWSVANVEYSAGDWGFLVVRGDREAEVIIEPRSGGSEVVIELSEPAGRDPGRDQGALVSAGGSKR